MYAANPSFTAPNAAAGPPDSGAAVPIVNAPVIGASAAAGSAHDEVSMVQPGDPPEGAVVPPADGPVATVVVLVGAAETRGAVTRGVVVPVRPPPPQEIRTTAPVASNANLLRLVRPRTIAPR